MAGKLIRDKTAEIIARLGGTPHFITLDKERYRTALYDEPRSTQDVGGEAAGVSEVLADLAGSRGISLDAIVADA